MYKKFEEQMLERNLGSIGVNFAISSEGNFILFPKGKGEDIKVYIEGNINDDNDEQIGSYIVNLLQMSLNKNDVEQYSDAKDKFRDFELAEYKKDKCKSMKYITINISKMYPQKIILVDMVNVAKFEWGGGKYMHFLPIDSKYSEVVHLLKNIYEYKGHMAGATNEQKQLYRKI